jgi:hypothetical protein
MNRNEVINELAQNLRLLHFHTVGAGSLAEGLYEAGYRLIPKEFQVLSDEEIRTLIIKWGDEYEDETMTDAEWEDKRDSLLARAQAESCMKQC